MRIVLKAWLAALASAALVGGMTLPALAGPHGGPSFGGRGGPSFGGRGGASFGGHGGPSFADARSGFSGRGAPSFSRGFSGRSVPSFSRGGFSRGTTFARGGTSGRNWRGAGSRTAMARGFSSRGSHGFATTAGSRFGGSRNAFGAGRNVATNGGWRGDFGANAGFRGGFDRGGFDRDRFGFDFDDLLWPIGLGFAFDWAIGYPACPYWGDWYGWCGPYPAAYWGYPWGQPYAWGPGYAWDAVYYPGYDYGYGWDYYGWNGWGPAPYGPPVGYAVWTPASGYAGYDAGCASRHYVWDPAVGAYVVRRDYDCWA